MLVYVDSDLFTSPAQTLVNTVNTVGVMGKGIAKVFKDIYPEMFRIYQRYCEHGRMKPGALLLYKSSNKWILNFPTKRHWRQRSRLDDIELGLSVFVDRYRDFGITSVAFPQLGCGNGELNWETEVRPLMEKYLGRLPIDVYVHIYAKRGTVPEHRDVIAMKAWLRGEPSSLPFDEFWDDLVRLADQSDVSNPISSGARVGQIGGTDQIDLGSGEDISKVSKDEMFDVWQKFRAFGFVSERDLPFWLGTGMGHLMALLTRLPYVEPAYFASIADSQCGEASSTEAVLNHRANLGLRLVPGVQVSPRSSVVATFDKRETQMCLSELMN